ncbi:MAG: hypothetical protein ABH851_02110 [Methanobacteriota archaeon]
MMGKKGLFVISLLFLVGQVQAISIGTAPGVLDLGEVRAGEDTEFEFYLLTNSPTDILVNLNPMRPHPNFYDKTIKSDRYTFIVEESSQNDVSRWIEIKRNPVIVSPAQVQTIRLANGAFARINTVVSAVLHVPADADKCYHAGSVNLAPELPPGPGGTGITTIGLTRFFYVFKVAGEGKREGEIIDIEAIREGANRVRFDVLFKNTGTCTVDARIEEIKVFGKYGNVTVTLSSPEALVKPGEIGILRTFWLKKLGEVIKSGDYIIEVVVDYNTGKRLSEKKINIPEIPITLIPGRIVKAFGCEFPWWIIAGVLVMAVISYVREWIDSKTFWRMILICILIAGYGAYMCPASIPWSSLFIVIIIILLLIYLRA